MSHIRSSRLQFFRADGNNRVSFIRVHVGPNAENQVTFNIKGSGVDMGSLKNWNRIDAALPTAVDLAAPGLLSFYIDNADQRALRRYAGSADWSATT